VFFIKYMARRIVPYNPILKERAKKLKKQSTLSEILLWNKIKSKQILGYDFHRQKPIDNYIVDFFCVELMLAIEIDGATHFDKLDYDQKRENKLNQLGITVLRFGDIQVKKNIESVVLEIKEWIETHE